MTRGPRPRRSVALRRSAVLRRFSALLRAAVLLAGLALLLPGPRLPGVGGAVTIGISPASAQGTSAGETQGEEDPRLPVGIAVLVFGALVVLFVLRARQGRTFHIRRIPGLEAIEESVGRATEMGRPILFVPGLESMDHVATVAAMNVLGEVAGRVAAYETPLLVPNRDPIVMAVAQEVVRGAFTAAGRADLYREENIYYSTYSQFGYAAAICGTMTRELPATNLFFGHFYAESLVLAETGNLTGAIQIAGTDADAQLPFFITACDYTLIGEELYAGSVYLSHEPLLMGTLRAQDVAKVLVILLLVAGSLLSLIRIVDLRVWLPR
jgi:hypothetical protein